MILFNFLETLSEVVKFCNYICILLCINLQLLFSNPNILENGSTKIKKRRLLL